MNSDRSALLAAVLADPGRVHQLGVEDAAVLLAQVAAIQATLAARVASIAQPGPVRRQEEDRLISVEDAAGRLGVTPRWLYRHAPRLPFARRLSRKALRFSELGLKRWQAAQGPQSRVPLEPVQGP